jgi:hypothetical protein
MKYMRKSAGYTMTYYKTKTEVAKGLNKVKVLDKIQDYRRNCVQHVKRMSRKKLQSIIKTTDQRQKQPGKTIKDNSGCVRPERK